MNQLEQNINYISIYFEKSNLKTYSKTLFFDKNSNTYYLVSDLKAIINIISNYGLYWVLKFLIKNNLKLLSPKYYYRFFLPDKKSFSIKSRNSSVLIFDLDEKEVIKINIIKKPFENELRKYQRVEALIDNLKIIRKKNHFPELYKVLGFEDEKLIVEISNLVSSQKLISENEWYEILPILSQDLLSYYDLSGIKLESIKDEWEFIKIKLNELDDLNVFNNSIDKFDKLLKEKEYLIYTCIVHSDLSRFNVIKGKNGNTIIDFSSGARKNIFYDLYIQEKWKPTNEFWNNIDNEKTIPDEVSYGWLKKFRKEISTEKGMSFTDIEIKFYYFFSFIKQFIRNNESMGSSNHQIVKKIIMK